MVQRVMAITLAITTFFSASLVALDNSEAKYVAFIDALMGDKDMELTFNESEALALMNAGAFVLFEDMPSVSATVSAVKIIGNTVEVTSALTVAGLTVRPQVTFASWVEGENVVVDIKRMRVGLIPMSVTAILTAIRAVGCPEYMQVHPLAGRIVVRKRGYVRYLERVTVGSGVIKVFVLGR